MEKIFSLLIFIIFFIVPSFTFSQIPNTTYATSYAGISIPNMSAGYSSSFNGGIALEFAIGKSTALGFDANFAQTGFDKIRTGRRKFGSLSFDDYNGYSTMGLTAFFKIF